MFMAYDLPGQRSETVRRSNLSAILRELHNRGPVSRSELVTRTGLTRSAIRGLIGELALSGFVSEQPGTPQGTPGRP
jgi:predicted ArsR family transcriptional regulator